MTKKQTVSVVLGSSKITLEFDNQPFNFQEILCEFEKNVIGHLLLQHKGIKAKVAKQLMLNRTTLVEKARKYGFPLKR